MDTRVSWTFTPRLSLQVYLQPFVAKGDYSGFKELHAPRAWGWDVYGEDVGTLSAEDGAFEISEIPPGTYTMVIWHESLERVEKEVTVAAGSTITEHLELTLK